MYGVNNSFDVLRLLEADRLFFNGKIVSLKPNSVDQQILEDPSSRQTLLMPHLKSRFRDAVGAVFLDAVYHPQEYEATISHEWNPDKNKMALTYVFSEAGGQRFRETCIKAVHYLCNGESVYLEALRAYTEQISDTQTQDIQDGEIETLFAQVWVSEEAVETQLLDDTIESIRAEVSYDFRLP